MSESYSYADRVAFFQEWDDAEALLPAKVVNALMKEGLTPSDARRISDVALRRIWNFGGGSLNELRAVFPFDETLPVHEWEAAQVLEWAGLPAPRLHLQPCKSVEMREMAASLAVRLLQERPFVGAKDAR